MGPNAENGVNCGGRRVKGVARQGRPGAPLISVILPVYNGGRTLEAAIDSVACQRYENLELVVIDGGSTDGSLEIIRAHEGQIDLWISEPDRGVYDAMNKGVDRACGDWLYFLGSDDILLDIVHEIVPHLKDSHTVYYGEVQLTSGKKSSGTFNRQWLIRKNIPHQAIIYPRNVFKKYSYDLKYPVAADYHLNLNCFGDSSFRFVRLPFVIAQFNNFDGLSSTRDDIAFDTDKPRLIRESFGQLAYLELVVRTGLKWFEKNVFRSCYRFLTGRRPAKRPSGTE